VKRALIVFYDLGAAVGVVGMAVGVGVLLWTLGELGVGLVGIFGRRPKGGVVKRALESAQVVQTSLLKPIVSLSSSLYNNCN
jgi:hypothetical protein